ncbi:hypothetical protein UlMin_009407 [Ulmus minor]
MCYGLNFFFLTMMNVLICCKVELCVSLCCSLSLTLYLIKKQFLKYLDHLESYTSDYTAQDLVGYCVVYIFMQTFMILGIAFISLLTGSLFKVFRGVALVVFTTTTGVSSCYFLLKMIGRPLVFSLWPDKLNFFQAQGSCNLLPFCLDKERERLLNYMIFLILTPTLSNMFINVASPIIDVSYHIFFLAIVIGLILAAYSWSVSDLYDLNSIATLFLIGVILITPTLVSKSKS